MKSAFGRGILASSLLTPDEFKKLKDGSMSFKITVAWRIVREKEENGKDISKIDKLKRLEKIRVVMEQERIAKEQRAQTHCK